jgi:hypothetical protein
MKKAEFKIIECLHFPISVRKTALLCASDDATGENSATALSSVGSTTGEIPNLFSIRSSNATSTV